MFTLAFLIGIYSYVILFIGLLGLLYKETVVLISVVYSLTILYFIREKLNVYKLKEKVTDFIETASKLEQVFLSLILMQSTVNLIGVLGPELGFDSLWYHLTLPKIFLAAHRIIHIHGSLLYYSDMPKFTEMLYVSALSFGTEIGAKLIHFSFGILSLIALYNLSRKFLSKTFSLLALVLFYSNLVVGWMSITAYVDLARTFFELMALWGFVQWQENKKSKWLIESAVMLGLAISTKLLALGSLFIFTFLIIFIFVQKHKFNWKAIITNILEYWCFALLIPLPWFVFSGIHTGNPFYPFFSNLYGIKFDVTLLNPLNFLKDLWVLFTNSPDRISPAYLIFLPVAFILFKKLNQKLMIIVLYSFLALLVWYITPRTGGGRFILPYLPAFSLATVAIIAMIKEIRLQKIFIGLIIFLSLFSILYRGVANVKYIPVILGKESKSHFLTNHLNFSFGDFYDTDGYFARKIKQEDMVLLYGFHNLYYVNFPFIDSSYVKKGDMFNYIAVQGNNLPKRFKIWSLIYYNDKTNVKLYYLGGIKWMY